ncbi:MAG: hybrid sensor histidine kinase/response regulator [Spirochaetales bacterium]
MTSLLALAKGHSVLYVDDHRVACADIKGMLESVFTRVVSVETAAAAREVFALEPFALVITELLLPDAKGLDLITDLWASQPRQAFLVTSNSSRADDLIPLFNLGIGSFVLKPLNWRLFLGLLHRELASAQALREENRYQERLEAEVRERTSQLQASQGQVLRLQGAKDTMLSLISHELRTPLNGILGFLELVKMDPTSADVGEFLGQIETSAHRLERSAVRILDYASASSGTSASQLGLYPLADLLALARAALREGMGELLEIRWATGAAGADLRTDRDLAVEVFRSLLENTAKYAAHPTAVVQVSLVQETNWTFVTLRDDGPGFPPTLLGTEFAPFSSGNVMHHKEGLGLGLALVDVLMLGLGGLVEARNPEHGGAELRLRFPSYKSRS